MPDGTGTRDGGSRTAQVALVLLIVLGLLLGPVLLVLALLARRGAALVAPAVPSHGDTPGRGQPTQSCRCPAR